MYVVFFVKLAGARRFDIDAEGLADKSSSFPHMLPTQPSHFARAVEALGVSDDAPVVVYSTNGFVGAARAWWMFHVYGKTDVSILNGGYSQWLNHTSCTASGPLQAIPVANQSANPQTFTPNFQPNLVQSMTQVLEHIKSRNAVIVDARSGGRFLGTSPEPRPGLLSGHMPGAVSLPFTECIHAESGKLKDRDQLRALLQSKDIPLSPDHPMPIVATCGTGVTAAVIALALHELGARPVAVYDGSWSEYGAYQSNPCERTPQSA